MTSEAKTAIQGRQTGKAMHALMRSLFPLCRSITGDGVRETLSILKELVPIETLEVPSATQCLDWQVPDEWNIKDAYVMDEAGQRVIDFQQNNLHIVSYSDPFDGEMTLDELKPHLHTLPDQPDAIPYRTSYYENTWGFCMAHRDFQRLAPGRYRVMIDATKEPGNMSYGELLIPGDTEHEILLSTNICHPSMANNELSGPVLVAFLARWLLDQPRRRYSYRLVWLPETIGALYYLSRHGDDMRQKTIAGYQVVCVGGPGGFTYLQTRQGNTVTDRVTRRVLARAGQSVSIVGYEKRGSDERQYGAPGFDLPVGSLMRSMYHDYPEYHTSLDDLDFVTPENLEASFDIYRACLDAIEARRTFELTYGGGEPNLGRRGLYATVGGGTPGGGAADFLAVLAYADGEHDLDDIAEIHGLDVAVIERAAETLIETGLLRNVN